MKLLVILISVLGLGLTIIPSVLVVAGQMDIETNKGLMVIGMLLWFASSPFWINMKGKKIPGGN